jgi:hypothetical protein
VASKDLDRPPTRAELNRMLVGNALTKPFPNILLPALIAIGGLVLGATWVVAVAVIAWLAFSAVTYFDGDEAARVAGEERDKRRKAFEKANPRVSPGALAPPIGQRLHAVLSEEQRIDQAITRADLPFEEVSGEVDSFVRAAEGTAQRAQLIYEYLSDHDPRAVEKRLASLDPKDPDPSRRALREAVEAQWRALQRGKQQLDRFYTEMERIAVELGNVRAELLAVSAASESAGQQRLAADVRDLREQMGAVSAGMSEALSEAPEA